MTARFSQNQGNTHRPRLQLPQFRGLPVNCYPFCPDLILGLLVYVTGNCGAVSDLQLFLWQSPAFHPRWRGEDNMPDLLVDLEIDETVRILITGFLDDTGELYGFRFVISGPAMMRIEHHDSNQDDHQCA